MPDEPASDDSELKCKELLRLVDLYIDRIKSEYQERAQARLSGMAVLYGLFFVLANALVGLLKLIIDTGLQFVWEFYLLLFMFSLSHSIVGGLIVFESFIAGYSRAFRLGMVIVLISVPQLFLYVFGLLLGIDRPLATASLFLNSAMSVLVARRWGAPRDFVSDSYP